MNKFPPYVLLITRAGGVGDLARPNLLLSTSDAGGGAGSGYHSVSHKIDQSQVEERQCLRVSLIVCDRAHEQGGAWARELVLLVARVMPAQSSQPEAEALEL